MNDDINFNYFKLSGKGFTSTQEWLDDNVKLVTRETQFHELIRTIDGTDTRVGWLIPNNIQLLADFTIHSEDGMQGTSVDDELEAILVIDKSNVLSSLIPNVLSDVDTSYSQGILDGMSINSMKLKGEVNLERDENYLVLISSKSEYVFVHSDDKTVRIKGSDGVYVLKRGKKEKVTIINDQGISVAGPRRKVHIGAGGIQFSHPPFNVGEFVKTITSSIGKTLDRDFDLEFDDEDAFDVDIDFDF